jgi:hypothetical protein
MRQMKRNQAANGFKRGKDAGSFPVRAAVTTSDVPVKWPFGANRRLASVMAVLSGLMIANKGGTAVNPVPFSGRGVF